MTLLENVLKLQETELKAEPEWRRGESGNIYCKRYPDRYPLMMPYGINNSAPEIELAVKLRNAAHAMLDVLRLFQHGDAKLLGDLIYIETESAKFAAGFGKIAPERQKIIDMLKRLQDAARKMEE